MIVKHTDDAWRAVSSGRLTGGPLIQWQERASDRLRRRAIAGSDLTREFLTCVGEEPWPWRGFAQRFMVRRMRFVTPPEDVVQNACISVLEGAASLPTGGIDEFVPWFQSIVLRRLADVARDATAQKRTVPGGIILSLDSIPDAGAEFPLFEPVSRALGPLEELLSTETYHRILRVVLALEEADSRIVILVDGFLLSTGEVAREFGLTGPALRNRLSRIHKKLRVILMRYGLSPFARRSTGILVHCIPGYDQELEHGEGEAKTAFS